MTQNTSNCANTPIEIKTSLPEVSASDFEAECRVLADVMCRSVIRTVERYCKRAKKRAAEANATPAIPASLRTWMLEANIKIPNRCRSLEVSVSDQDEDDAENQLLQANAGLSSAELAAARRFQKATFTSIRAMGAQLTSAPDDIDDWIDPDLPANP